MNHILKTRAEINKYFDTTQVVEGSRQTSLSQSKKYKLDTVQYRQNAPGRNWTITKIKIHHNIANEVMFEFKIDNDSFFHQWLTIGGEEYLIFAEAVCGGQSIIDFNRKIFESYDTPEDGFIWTSFHLSPDNTKLAVIGCVWACPYEIKIYDFSNPLDLPLTEISTLKLGEEEKAVVDWFNNNHIRTENYNGVSRIRSVNSE